MMRRPRSPWRGRIAEQFVRGSLVSFFMQGTGAGLIFVSELVLARVLGAGSYGLFAMVMAWLQVLATFALLGSNHLLLRLVPTYVATQEWPLLGGLLRYCSRITLVFGLAIFLAGVVLLTMLGEYVADETRRAFLVGLAAVPVAALSLQRQAVLRGLHRVAAALSPELIVRPVLLMLTVAGMAWGLGMTVSASVGLAMNGAALIATFLFGRYWQNQAVPAQTCTVLPAVKPGDWLRIAGPLFLISGMQLLIVRLDIMLLGVLAGHEDAGRYAAASRISDLIVFALASANVVVAPLIAGLHARNDIAGMQTMLVSLAKGVTLLTIPLVAVIVLFGKSLLGFFGHGYEAVYLPLLILVCGQIVNALSGPVDFVMSMTGQQVNMLKILAIATGLNAVFNLLLIPQFGPVGAAVATAGTTVFWNLAMRRAVRRKLGIDASVLVLLRGHA